LASAISGTRAWKFSSQDSAVPHGVTMPEQLSNVPSMNSWPMRNAAGPS
jgi:hypothetical protein